MDSITMQADFYTSCDVDKLLTTCTKLVTVEGLSELAARALGAIPFEYMSLIAIFKDQEATDTDKGNSIGRALSVTFNYSI